MIGFRIDDFQFRIVVVNGIQALRNGGLSRLRRRLKPLGSDKTKKQILQCSQK